MVNQGEILRAWWTLWQHYPAVGPRLMQELIPQFRLLRLSRVHPCLLFIIALLHLAGSRTREKQPRSFSFLVCSCAIINGGEHQPDRLGFCISEMLSADYHGINTNVKDSWFNSEFSNSYRTRVSILKKRGGIAKPCCSSKNTKRRILKLFFFSWSTFCMTHEPGSKMASKHACIILHIPVSAYAVLLNIPRRWLCCWGGAGKGQRSSSPEGPKFVLASLPWWPYPAFHLLWSSTSIWATCSSPQVCAGLVKLGKCVYF